MSSIPGLEKLSVMLSEADTQGLTRSADRHFIASNMTFTILSVSEGAIEIETAQGETKSGKYASQATLISRTRELFSKYLPEIKLHIFAATYAPSPASTVTTKWLEEKMKVKGIRIKQIAFETGIGKESISDWVTGKKSMSQIVKAMFYFYLSR
ncbi:MAG: XRE family transcriptional regulator [Pedobacter sp.]|nr:MAG: XRE family transcriptional regulator [Pedobacter sp.]